jgi:linoleoyl-CoA desaturase
MPKPDRTAFIAVEPMSVNRVLSPDELERFGAELDALRDRTVAKLGERDVGYIRRVIRTMRSLELLGRALLFVGWFPPAWLLGTLCLGVSKIIDNMEVGHNVIHGQYDWTGDPQLMGQKYEWDIVGTAANWRYTHNFRHHTYTNVRGMDDDIGYGLLRIFPEQRWSPFHLAQPLVALIFAFMFQWGVAIQALRVGRLFAGRISLGRMAKEFKPVGKKMAHQLMKDYVLWPLLAGPFFLPVMLGNLCANGMRNLWTYTIIFCGHFTADAQTFPKSVLRHETRGQWYLRQLRGSSNLAGSRLLHFMSGNLSHQIEHHFYPNVPSCRYAEMAIEVRQICARYGQHYNTGSLLRQFGQVIWRILRHSLPSRPATARAPQMG